MSWKSFTDTKTNVQTLVAPINQCVASYPGVCSRACRSEISQMGFNWGSFVFPEDTCKPKPSECCCQINQMGVQKVTRCQDKSTCVGIDMGVQSIGCLLPDKLPLVSGNRSSVCGLSTEFFCNAQTRLAELIPFVSVWPKYVGYAFMLSSLPVILSGGLKMMDSEKSEDCLHIMTCCGVCMSVLALALDVIYEQILRNSIQDIKPLCGDEAWSTATEGCNPTCRTAVTRLMEGAVCQELKNITSVLLVGVVYKGFWLFGMGFLFGISCCCKKKKTTTKYYQFQNVAQQGTPHAPSTAYGQPYPQALATAYVPPVWEENK